MRALFIAIPLMLASATSFACTTQEQVQAKSTEMQTAAMAAAQKNPTKMQEWSIKIQKESIAMQEEAVKNPAMANDMVRACKYLDEKIAELKELAK